MAQRRRARAKMNIPMCLAIILLCLTGISVYLASDIFARYSTTASAEDSARVAKFDVAVTGADKNAVIAYASTNADAHTVTVVNQSEVAVRYHVAVTFDAAVNGVTVLLDGNGGTVDGTTTTFTDAGTLPPNAGAENAKNHTLSFQMNWGVLDTADWASLVGTGTKGGSASQSLSYTVTVNVEQVD